MLKTIALTAALLVTLPIGAAAQLTQQDRDTLIQDLERSRKIFLDAIADVKTEAQWNYKPAPDRWSVAECAAHIIAAEQFFRDNVATAMKAPAVKVADQAKGDAQVSTFIRNRSQRFTAPAQLEPTGKVVPKAQAIKDFEATRAKSLDYVRTTKDALRDHAVPFVLDQTTAYQLVLIMSGHTERHTAQLMEVKASPGYPKQ